MLILIGLLVGLLIGLFVNVLLPASLVPFLAVLTLVGIESLTAAWNAVSEATFEAEKVLIEFFVNALIAVLMTALGNQMKYDFSMVVSFIFAYRIFRNINFTTRKFYLRRKEKGSLGKEEKQASMADKTETISE